MRYLREGWSIAQVAYLGRWKSSVVYKYAEEALVEMPVLSEKQPTTVTKVALREEDQKKDAEVLQLKNLWDATAVKVEKYKADSKAMSKELRQEVNVHSRRQQKVKACFRS